MNVRTTTALHHPDNPCMAIVPDDVCSIEAMIQWLGSRARYDYAVKQGWLEEVKAKKRKQESANG